MRRIGWLTRSVLAGDSDEAMDACRDLGLLGDVRVVGPLLAASGRGGRVGPAAVDALVAVGDVGVPALVRGLAHHPDGGARVALERLGPVAADAILAGATGRNRQVRRCCIQSLVTTDEHGERVLWGALTDVDCGVRTAAWDALESRGAMFSVEQVLDYVARCRHEPSHVASGLLRPWLSDERVRSVLRSRVAMAHTGSPAAEMLAHVGGQELVWLTRQLESSDPVVVRHVARAVVHAGHGRSRRVAAAVVFDRAKPAEVRAAAAVALSDVDEDAAAVTAGDPNEPVAVRRACAGRLPLADPRFAPLATTLLADMDPQLRALPISRTSVEVVTPAVLRRALEDVSPFVRRLALWRLLPIGEQAPPQHLDECLPVLALLNHDPDVSVRETAASLLVWRSEPWAHDVLAHLAAEALSSTDAPRDSGP